MVEVLLLIFGPTDANVKGPLENSMAVTGGGGSDEFEFICIEEAVS